MGVSRSRRLLTRVWLPALALVVVTVTTVTIFVKHPWWMPVDISAEGPGIDRQIFETLVASGILFVLGQLLLGSLIWKFAGERHVPANFISGLHQACAFRPR